MKKYFEYPLDELIKNKLSRYYENVELEQHNDQHFAKAEMKLERIKKPVNFSDNDSVLDIGCSSGYTLVQIAEKIKTGLGLDISQSIIARNKAGKHPANLDFDVFNGVDIPASKKYDKILMLDVLEHAFYPDQLLSSAINVLADDGEIMIEVPFSGWLSEILYGAYHQGHLRYYDPQHLSTYLNTFNLKIKEVHVYNSVPFASLFLRILPVWKFLDYLVNLIPAKIYPYFGEILIIVNKQ